MLETGVAEEGLRRKRETETVATRQVRSSVPLLRSGADHPSQGIQPTHLWASNPAYTKVIRPPTTIDSF